MKNTIKLFSMMIMAAGLLMVQPVSAQTRKQEKREIKEEKRVAKEQKKEQQEIRDAVFQKAPKNAVKEAKKLEREGWKSMGLPIAKQQEETWMRMADREPNGYPRYIWAQEIATGNSFAAAQSQADNVAKLRIASSVSSSIAALTDVALANQEINAKEAASITKTVENAKVIVAQRLGRTFKTMEIYQELRNGNYRVRSTMFYDMKSAVTIAREVMMEELKKSSEINKEQLEKLIGINKLMDQVAKDITTYDEIAE
ncbi:MAG: hypothetical protein II865_07305 [Bacteroidales bacterium]|nr:hypothetical protein [Bacteroidales bacterium]